MISRIITLCLVVSLFVVSGFAEGTRAEFNTLHAKIKSLIMDGSVEEASLVYEDLMEKFGDQEEFVPDLEKINELVAWWGGGLIKVSKPKSQTTTMPVVAEERGGKTLQNLQKDFSAKEAQVRFLLQKKQAQKAHSQYLQLQKEYGSRPQFKAQLAELKADIASGGSYVKKSVKSKAKPAVASGVSEKEFTQLYRKVRSLIKQRELVEAQTVYNTIVEDYVDKEAFFERILVLKEALATAVKREQSLSTKQQLSQQLQKAKRLYSARKYTEAKEFLTDLVKQYPNSKTAAVLLKKSDIKIKRAQEVAVKKSAVMQKKKKDTPPSQRKQEALLFKRYKQAIVAAIKADDFGKARALLEEAQVRLGTTRYAAAIRKLTVHYNKNLKHYQRVEKAKAAKKGPLTTQKAHNAAFEKLYSQTITLLEQGNILAASRKYDVMMAKYGNIDRYSDRIKVINARIIEALRQP